MQPIQMRTTPSLNMPSAKSIVLCVLLGLAALAAYVARPVLHEAGSVPDLEKEVPTKIDQWVALTNPISQVSLTTEKSDTDTDINQPYDQSVLRTYADGQGHTVAVALAWGKRQRQEVKIHRPELCYPAQGLAVKSITDVTFPVVSSDKTPIIGKRMITMDRNGQMELVSYWIRIGHVYSDSAWKTRMHILNEGLAGRVTDGMLVRVSQRLPMNSTANIESTFARQEAFAASLVGSVPPATRQLLAR